MCGLAEFPGKESFLPEEKWAGTAHKIAGHHFRSLTPGEYCFREGCTGISSLRELLSQCEFLKVGEMQVAHYGGLNSEELEEIRRAKENWDRTFTISY